VIQPRLAPPRHLLGLIKAQVQRRKLPSRSRHGGCDAHHDKPAGPVYLMNMSRFLAIVAVLALVLAPASAEARHAFHVSEASVMARTGAMSERMASCAEHSSKQTSDCNARCELACASAVALNAPVQGAGLSAPAEQGPADMTMGAPVSPRPVAAALLDRPPKFTV